MKMKKFTSLLVIVSLLSVFTVITAFRGNSLVTLGNLVWNDANGNGIREAYEAGVGGVTVKLYADNDANNLPDGPGNGTVIATTTTGIDGSYSFTGLAGGRYIAGLIIPAGYTVSPNFSLTPDNNIDNDNNSAVLYNGGTEIRSNAITLSVGDEPLNDGDGFDGNLTLDLAICGNSNIGNYVWCDRNANGLQEDDENGFANVSVMLTFPDGTTYTKLTDANGNYQFVNLGPGTYTLNFTTPAGFMASPALVGSNREKDSDPINGKVTVNVGASVNDYSIDAGFYIKKCPVPGPCGPGSTYLNILKNGNFTSPVVAGVTPGNTYTGTANTDPGTSYSFQDGSSFKSQSDYRGTGYADQIGGFLDTDPGQNAFSLINTGGAAYIASNQELVNQLPFPGDPANGVPATNNFMFYNGNQYGPALSLVWEQTLSGLTPGKTYIFRFYASNMIEPSASTNPNYHDPLIVIHFGGTSGIIDGVNPGDMPGFISLSPAFSDQFYQLDKAATSNASALNGWKRFEVKFTATSSTKILKILDCAKGNYGDNLALTAIGLDECVVIDRDEDCVPDIDDLDDDNDGIIDEVENNGYDALKDCDGDGIVNYLDQTPGCATRLGNDIFGKPFVPLTWSDCNNDGVNDFFDWDRDGIINELDLDSDNDGILDIQEARDVRATDNNKDGMADGIDDDGDGIMSTADVDDHVYGGPGLNPEDLDRDGTPNYLDLDSDGDGISDIKEALIFGDSDGLVDGTDSDKDGVRNIVYNNNDNTADNFNGFGAKGIKLTDTDNDGKPNPYDIDSDDDGITDNVEAQPTCNEKQPTGVDTDGDGLDDAYDTNNNACNKIAPGITPYDKDGDGTPDIYDLDTDNDGAPDVNEGSGIPGNFVTNYNDTDGDGLIDQFDVFNIKTAVTLFTNNVTHSNMGPNGSFDGPVPSGSNAQLPQSAPGDCSTGADRDWRDITILPVDLVEFKGNLNNNTIRLTWTVANEINMKRYVVERGLNGQTFAAVGQVNTRGNSTVSNTYAFNDDVSGLTSNTLYYRLRLVDNSGNAKLSNTVTFKRTNKAGLTMAIHPNPAGGYFVLKVNAVKDGMAVTRITDMFGRMIKMQNNRIAAGLNAISFTDLSNMAAGNYNLQLIMDGEVITQKLVVVK